MAQNTYKGIVFAEGYNKPFAEFKAEFEQTHVFKKIPSGERLAALKDAHKIATKGNGNTRPAVNQNQSTNPDEA